MKKIKRIPILLSSLLCLILLIFALTFTGGTNKAFAYEDYRFTIESYSVDYTINKDRTMYVEEITQIKFEGEDSTGHVHLIPVNAGDRVHNLKVYELFDGKESKVEYSVTDEYSGYIGADIGDYSNKTGQTRTYKLTYTYSITKPVNKNAIYLNPIGFGWDCEIKNADVTLRLPDGYINDDSCYFIGKTTTPIYVSGNYSNGVIHLTATDLAKENGITFNLYFEDGVLTTKTDYSPYWAFIPAFIILVVIIVLRLLVFNKDGVAPVTSVEPPEDMDPLEMGKLIDNKIDQSDVTSLIYYWASKGYLKIDLSDDKDVKLIRIRHSLPEKAPQHQRIMYNRLFESGDMVRIESLKNSFYSTVDTVTIKVNAETGKLYSGRSMGVSVIFTLLGALLMAITPIIIGMATISYKLVNLMPLFAIIPSFIIMALMQTIKFNKFKKKKTFSILSILGTVLLCAGFTALYCLFVPSYIIEVLPKILLCTASYLIIIGSVTLINRTPAYTEKLNKILGFRDFIESVEKDRLETMLEDNPELYYNVLPYAQVLGVSDVWEKKFASLTIAPPRWAIGYTHSSVFDFIVFNSVMRSVNRQMVTSMTGRPSSGGMSGGGGGSFGGGGGGGHGGGGGFGR
ncbi:MAG: DUF2207 domain-containing protein [Candidatus Coproplasma sp.]